MSLLKGIGRFCYDFVIGDDWKIAAAVVLALGAALAVLLTGTITESALPVVGAGMLVSAFAAAVVIDVRT